MHSRDSGDGLRHHCRGSSQRKGQVREHNCQQADSNYDRTNSQTSPGRFVMYGDCASNGEQHAPAANKFSSTKENARSNRDRSKRAGPDRGVQQQALTNREENDEREHRGRQQRCMPCSGVKRTAVFRLPHHSAARRARRLMRRARSTDSIG